MHLQYSLIQDHLSEYKMKTKASMLLLNRQIGASPIDTNCAPLVADLLIVILNIENQTEFIDAFNSTSIYLSDLSNIDNPYFEGMVSKFIHLNYS